MSVGLDRYHVLGQIGEGSFGRVFKGRQKCTGQFVALKFMSKAGKSGKELAELRTEVSILQRLDHPNIILMLDCFETARDVVLVTEYAHGELFQILTEDKELPEVVVQAIAKQLVSALHYLHRHRIIHRDMKPQNVLVGSGGNVKLADFGFARQMSASTMMCTSIKGTPLYLAPEIFHDQAYEHKADLWGLGVMLYELCAGRPPFHAHSLHALMQKIMSEDISYPDKFSPSMTSFLSSLLVREPTLRGDWPGLLTHPWVCDGASGERLAAGSSPPPATKAVATSSVSIAAAPAPVVPRGGAGSVANSTTATVALSYADVPSRALAGTGSPAGSLVHPCAAISTSTTSSPAPGVGMRSGHEGATRAGDGSGVSASRVESASLAHSPVHRSSHSARAGGVGTGTAPAAGVGSGRADERVLTPAQVGRGGVPVHSAVSHLAGEGAGGSEVPSPGLVHATSTTTDAHQHATTHEVHAPRDTRASGHDRPATAPQPVHRMHPHARVDVGMMPIEAGPGMDALSPSKRGSNYKPQVSVPEGFQSRIPVLSPGSKRSPGLQTTESHW